MSLIDQSLSSLLDAFSSADPTPGGGSASALAGALGVSLFAMVAGMPKTKHGTTGEREALDRAHERLLVLRGRLLDLVHRDSAAYDLVVAAFRRPKGTEQEKAIRKEAIQNAMRVATEVPVETARACAEALEAGRTVAEAGNPNAKSDIGVGTHLLMSAIAGALLNVATNLGSLSDQGVVDAILKHVNSLAAGGGAAHLLETSGAAALMREAAAKGMRPHLHQGGPPVM